MLLGKNVLGFSQAPGLFLRGCGYLNPGEGRAAAKRDYRRGRAFGIFTGGRAGKRRTGSKKIRDCAGRFRDLRREGHAAFKGNQ